jgi:hypothetical protein
LGGFLHGAAGADEPAADGGAGFSEAGFHDLGPLIQAIAGFFPCLLGRGLGGGGWGGDSAWLADGTAAFGSGACGFRPSAAQDFARFGGDGEFSDFSTGAVV